MERAARGARRRGRQRAANNTSWSASAARNRCVESAHSTRSGSMCARLDRDPSHPQSKPALHRGVGRRGRALRGRRGSQHARASYAFTRSSPGLRLPMPRVVYAILLQIIHQTLPRRVSENLQDSGYEPSRSPPRGRGDWRSVPPRCRCRSPVAALREPVARACAGGTVETIGVEIRAARIGPPCVACTLLGARWLRNRCKGARGSHAHRAREPARRAPGVA